MTLLMAFVTGSESLQSALRPRPREARRADPAARTASDERRSALSLEFPDLAAADDPVALQHDSGLAVGMSVAEWELRLAVRIRVRQYDGNDDLVDAKAGPAMEAGKHDARR